MRRVPPLLLFLMLGTGFEALGQPPDPRLGALNEFDDAARLAPDLSRGAKLFETCAGCHGENGSGTEDGEIPAIAGQHGSVLLSS
jgi:cytochrome c553